MDLQTRLPRSKTTMLFTTRTKLDRTTVAEPEVVAPRSHSRFRKFAWVGVLVAVLGAIGFFRLQKTSESAEPSVPYSPAIREVSVTTPERAAAGQNTLPGTVQAYQATDLYARANGFLKSWTPEIGTIVKKGDVLAEIETPELDQELAQTIALHRQGQAEHQQSIAELEEAQADVALAEANVVKAKANVDFAVSQANRYDVLVNTRAASRQEYESVVRERDARNAELESAKADVKRRQATLGTRRAMIDSRAAVVRNREANVQRLRDLTGFQKVVAPFDGVVTRRNAEVGMLVSAGTGAGSRPLFSVAQIDVLRVQVAVPQSSALAIKAGDSAQVIVPEMPGESFRAKVTRTAGAVEPTSRSLLVEVELPNRDSKLLPGIYAQVRFESSGSLTTWIIPAKTVLMRSDGPHVAIVGIGSVVRLQKVTVGRDFGTSAEVLSGLDGGERLIVNPTDDLRDGQVVNVSDGSEAQRRLAAK